MNHDHLITPQNSKPTREMFLVDCRTSVRIVDTSRYCQVPECCLFSLLEARTNDIIATEVKDKKFREEVSSRSMSVAVERIERDRRLR